MLHDLATPSNLLMWYPDGRDAGSLEVGDLCHLACVKLEQHFHQQFDAAIKIGALNYAVVSMKIACGNGNIRSRHAGAISLQFLRILEPTLGNLCLQRDVVFLPHLKEKVTQPKVHQHPSVCEIDHRPFA